MDLSKQKALSIVETISEGIIISADSVITVGQQILEKPKNLSEARDMLILLSGTKNTAITGVTIYDVAIGNSVTFYEETVVYFDDLTHEEIDWYLKNEAFLFDRAGYSIAGKASLFVSKIDGDYNNILGLPMNRIYSELKAMGFSLGDFV